MKRLPPFILLALIVAICGTLFWTAPYFLEQSDQNVLRAPAQQSRAAPEAATGYHKREEVETKKFMVAAANPLATKAGVEMINQGGNAIDAAIAVQMVLTLVEPQSSGIGGGAFLLFFDAKTRQLNNYDGREVAPSAVTEQHFLRDDGSALGFGEAVRSGRSIGVPGVIRMMYMAHKAHGKLPWKTLFQPAIKLATTGFAVSPRLHKMLNGKGADFFNSEARQLFFDKNEQALAVGSILKNPAFAESLTTIADKGADGFYLGELAEKIVLAAAKAPKTPSLMTGEDLKAYQAKERPSLCGTYKTYKICGMGAPSSGGTTVAMILKLIEPLSLGKSFNVDAMHLIAEAEKLAFADRNRYMADPDFVPQPLGFLSDDYLAQRRELIDTEAAMEKAKAGDVPLAEKAQYGEDATVELGGTSHVSIIDKDGNALSMTSSIEGAFGSGQMVGGFLLNNQLTDFSFKAKDKNGKAIANRVAPFKRPRSSMSPTIVFDEKGDVKIVVGSPGGSRIILFVVKALVAHFNWGLGPQDAVSLINFGSRNGPFELEDMSDVSEKPDGYDTFASELISTGHKVRLSRMTSGTQMIVVENDTLKGGADPRREGAVMGE